MSHLNSNEEHVPLMPLIRHMLETQSVAIYSAQASSELAQNWLKLEEVVRNRTISDAERLAIDAMSQNHKLLARHVIEMESQLEQACGEGQAKIGEMHESSEQESFRLKRRRVMAGDTEEVPQSVTSICPMRTWFYENLLHPFPSMSVRRDLQRLNGMSMSNINGWFSNMRRRSGWNTHLQELANGNRTSYKHIIQGCFDGTERNRVVRQKVEDMVDYALGRARGGVGEWLTDVVGGEAIDSQNRMPSTNEIVSPPSYEKRRKIISHREHSVFRNKIDYTQVDIDEEFFELGSDKLGMPNEIPAMSHGWSTHPQRSFSSSSCGSTISDVSAAVPEEPVFRPFHPPSYHHQSMVDGRQYGLPVSFGGPQQQLSFQPVLNRQDVLRKRTQSQAEDLDTNGRTAKVARFS